MYMNNVWLFIDGLHRQLTGPLTHFRGLRERKANKCLTREKKKTILDLPVYPNPELLLLLKNIFF